MREQDLLFKLRARRFAARFAAPCFRDCKASNAKASHFQTQKKGLSNPSHSLVVTKQVKATIP